MLGHFNISLHQIYSVTTDNGRNMVKAVGLLSTSNIGEEEEDEEEGESDVSIPKTNCAAFFNGMGVVSFKCAAHTLQLAVKDFLKDFS